MTDLKVTITIQDPELDDAELQEYTENLLPQICKFDGVEAASLTPREQPDEEEPDITPKDFGAFTLGAITFTTTVKTITEIVDWVEQQWLEGNRQSDRKMLVEVTTPDGYKFAYTADNEEDLNAFLKQVNRAVKASME